MSRSRETSSIASPAQRVGIKAHLQRGELMAADCPSRAVLMHVTSRWGVLLLVALLSGTHRFSDLRRKVGGVSEKMLAQTLQALEGDGFVERRSYPVVPPHVDYTLTAMGVEVATKVEALADWIEANLPRIVKPKAATKAAKNPPTKLPTKPPATTRLSKLAQRGAAADVPSRPSRLTP